MLFVSVTSFARIKTIGLLLRQPCCADKSFFKQGYMHAWQEGRILMCAEQCTELTQGTPSLIIPTIKAKLLKTLIANYCMWPLAHIINFKFIPSSQRILYINCVQVMCLLALLYLSGSDDAASIHMCWNFMQHLMYFCTYFQECVAPKCISAACSDSACLRLSICFSQDH